MSGSLSAVLCLAPHVEDRLLPQLPDAGVVVLARPASAAEAADAVRRLRPDLLLASADGRWLDGALLLTAAELGVRPLVLAEGESGRSAAAALGVRHPWPASATAAELVAATDASDDEPSSDRVQPVARGRVTVVWGPAGAPGRTSTAVALAAELAGAGARTVLVDADTVAAAVAPSLGLPDEAPGLAAACRLAAANALTAGELERVAQRCGTGRGGFAVLTGINRAQRWPELSEDRVTAVLEQCRGWAEHVVVDVGASLEADEEIVSDLFAPRRNAATLAALKSADRVVAVGAADPVGLSRFVRGYADLLELVDQPRVHVVVTKVRRSAVGLGAGGQIRASLARFAGIEDAALVPSDPVAYDAALLTARPLPDAAPRSAATAVLHRFAVDVLLDRPAAAARRAPLLRHLRRTAAA